MKRPVLLVTVILILIYISFLIIRPLITTILSSFPDTASTQTNLPFSLSKISITVNFIIYFAITFLIVIDILASLVIGLVNKGEEKEGFKYTIPLVILSISIFFITRFIILRYFSSFFNS